MKIRTKIFLTFSIVGLILTIVGIGANYFFVINNLKTQICNHLETAAQSRAQYVVGFLEGKKELAENLALIEKVEKLLLTDKTDPDYNNTLISVKERLKKSVDASEEILGITVVDKSGVIITSTIEFLIGKDRSKEVAFLEGIKDTYVHGIVFPIEGTEVPIIFVSAPITKDNKVLGVVVIRLGVEGLFEITKERTGLGKTGEVYLVNRDGYMITPSRFQEDVVLKQKVDTVNYRNCFGMKSEEHLGHKEFDVFENYRGAPVLGTHVRIPEMNWCLLAEIDESEALEPVNRILWASILFGLDILLIVFLIAGWIAQRISEPIKKLQKGIEIIEKGNLDYKVGIKTKNEIGQLSRSFDKMVASIKKSRAEIDRKVKQQTHEIRKSRKKLEEQQKAILNVLEDVEEEKVKIEQERSKLDIILQGIGDGVFVVDKNYRITLFNKVAANISGFTAREAIGKKYDKVLKFVYEKNEKASNKFIKEAITTGKITTMSNHTVLVSKKGSKIPVADSAASLRNKKGEIIGCVVVFRDVTKERELDQRKSEFISITSHQLRTPLSAMKWLLEMLLAGDMGKLKKEQAEITNDIYQSNQRMIKLVNDLLTVSRSFLVFVNSFGE
mgnify:CR=1 FL=1